MKTARRKPQPERDGISSRFAFLRFALYWLDQRPIHFMLIGLLSVGVALWLHVLWPAAEYFDNFATDSYFKARAVPKPEQVARDLPNTKNIIMVEANYIMSRQLHAQLLEKLKLAKVVAFDYMFVDQEKELSDEERRYYLKDIHEWRAATAVLARQIRKNGNVVLGIWPEEQAQVGKNVQGSTIDIERNSQEKLNGEKRISQIWQRPPDALWNAAKYHARLDVEPGKTRRVNLFENTPQRTPCMGLVLAGAWLGLTPKQINELKIENGYLIMKGRRIPVGGNSMRIDYVGGRDSFEYGENHAAYTFVLDYQPEDYVDFKDKIVIIGESTLKSKEIFETPYGLMPGMQVHANVAATLLSDVGAPCDLPIIQTAIISLCACVVLIAPLLRWPLWASLVTAGLLAGIILYLGKMLFSGQHLVLPFSIPLIAIFLTYNAVALYEYRRARETLGRFIGREMVAPTLSLFSRLHLGGHVEEASAFFCDLRGYTAMAGQLAPGETARLIMEYTSTLVRVVKKHGGRPIDYQGDGVFILFERAMCGNEFARRAITAALDFEKELEKLRQKWKNEGAAAAEVSIGIGIETGPVMIGFIGAEEHMKQGAIGNAVNVASRVQQLSTVCGYSILFTQATRESAGEEFCDEHGAVNCGFYEIRGLQEPMEIFGAGMSHNRKEPEDAIS